MVVPGNTQRTAPSPKTTIRLGHSPDPDDAFMWRALANFVAPDGAKLTPTIDTRGYDFVHVLEDIQSLNMRSERGELEITALSTHQYPFVADKYALTHCGASMGDDYGPMIVSRCKLRPTELAGKSLAIPGERTSAWLACQILLAEEGLSTDELRYRAVPFDQIIPRVAGGEFDAGLIIHEGQLTYRHSGLVCVADLGAWWTRSRGLPLPLGANAIRRDLGPKMEELCAILLDSIRYALAHRHEAVAFSLNYARDLGPEPADRFVAMYVNKWTLDYGERGRRAVRQFIREGIDAGLVPDCGEIDFVYPR